MIFGGILIVQRPILCVKHLIGKVGKILVSIIRCSFRTQNFRTRPTEIDFVLGWKDYLLTI